MNFIRTLPTQIFMLYLLGSIMTVAIGQETVENREYKIKAAFLYNLIKTVEWPEEAINEPNNPIIIGIVGENKFGESLDPLLEKTAKGRSIKIEYFKGPSQFSTDNDWNEYLEQSNLAKLKNCYALFICGSENQMFQKVLNILKDYPILTIGETEEFIETDGMIGFIPNTNKAVFEINLSAIEAAKLKISSKLIPLAKRVINE